MLKYHGVPYRSRQDSGLLGTPCPWPSSQKHMGPLSFFTRPKKTKKVKHVSYPCCCPLSGFKGWRTDVHSFIRTVRAKVHEPAIGIDFESKFLQRFSKDRSAWFFDATAIHCMMGGGLSRMEEGKAMACRNKRRNPSDHVQQDKLVHIVVSCCPLPPH